MKRLNVLRVPDYRLRLVSTPVEQVTKEIQSFVKDMFLTMMIEGGVGLSAPQVNVQKRIIVMRLGLEGEFPLVLINPLILSSEGEIESVEGCLSVPKRNVLVKRTKTIKVCAQNESGTFFEFTTSDLPSIVIQHEIDHLNGTLICDFA